MVEWEIRGILDRRIHFSSKSAIQQWERLIFPPSWDIGFQICTNIRYHTHNFQNLIGYISCALIYSLYNLTSKIHQLVRASPDFPGLWLVHLKIPQALTCKTLLLRIHACKLFQLNYWENVSMVNKKFATQDLWNRLEAVFVFCFCTALSMCLSPNTIYY